MDKCWFVLRQTHYPPPTLPKSRGESSQGAICLGHIIRDLEHLDQVINIDGPLPYPRNMPLLQTTKWDYEWQFSKRRAIDVSAKAEVPVVAAPINAKIDVGTVFKRCVTNSNQFERLDTTIIQPTLAYIEDSLEDELVEEFLDGKAKEGLSSWTLLMVSGLVIARGAKGKIDDASETGVRAYVGVSLPGIVEVGPGVEVETGTAGRASFQKATDFVWAIRLTRIKKPLFSSKLKIATVVQGATFSLEDKEEVEEKVEDVLLSEGLDTAVGVTIYGTGEDVFVLQENIDGS